MSSESSPTSSSDQELQFKKRARRRLVGAIALVLIMVAVLPMVLDDRTSKAPPQDIAISIPSQENSDFTSKIVPLQDDGASSQDAPAVPADMPGQADTDEGSEAPVAQPPAPVTPPKPAEVSRPEPVRAEPKPEASKPEASKPVADKKPVDKPQPEKKLAEGAAVVQIGVFSDMANIKQLQQKLTALGFKSYTEKINTPKGEKTRLRAGPFASRQDAEHALDKIKGGGLTGMVVSK